MKLLKSNILYVLIFLVVITSIFSLAEAFSIDFNPVSFLQKTLSLMLNNISNTIDYLISKKSDTLDEVPDSAFFSTNTVLD